MKLLFGVSFPGTALAFLRGQLGYLGAAGHETALVAPDSKSGGVAKMCREEQAAFFQIPLERRPNLTSDLKSVLGIFKAVKEFSPDAVVAGTPKASLLVLGVSFVMRVEHRVYLCHGLRFEGFYGWKKAIAQMVERLFCALATRTVAVSDSVKDGLVSIGVPSSHISVLGSGSPNGVDISRFKRPDVREREQLREDLGMRNSGGELLFVGRLTHDKGIRYLRDVAAAMPQISMTLIGDVELSRDADSLIIDQLSSYGNVRFLGPVEDVSGYMKAADLLLLPSMREGLPTVVIEAAACGLPVVAMEATGTVDAVASCECGSLTPQGSSLLFLKSVRELLDSESERWDIGTRAAKLAAARFGNRVVWDNWLSFMEKMDSATV